MASSAASIIDELYTGCDKSKKQKKQQPSPPQSEETAALLAKLKKLEKDQIESDKRFNAAIEFVTSHQKKVEELSKKQLDALNKENEQLKKSLNAEQKRNLELTQQLADAKSTVNKSIKENTVDDARIEELMSELEITNDELQEAQKANEVAYDSIQQFEDAFAELTRQMQQAPEAVKGKLQIDKQLNAVAAVLKSDAIFQSKRQKAASLFGQYFTDLLKYAKAFGEGKLKSGVEAVRDANNKIFPRIVKTANSIAVYMTDKVYGTTLVSIAEFYRDYLRAYYELKSKSKSIIEANAIQKIVDEDNFPENRTVADAFIKKYQNNKQQVEEVVKQLNDLWLRAGLIVETVKRNAKEKDLDVNATIEIPLVRLMSDIVFYGAAQLSGEANDYKAATKMKEGIISESKTFGLDLYVGLTDSKDRSLVERFNPFKDQKSATTETAATTSAKPTNSKLKFRVVNF